LIVIEKTPKIKGTEKTTFLAWIFSVYGFAIEFFGIGMRKRS
jgi:hypothetical protein